MMRTAVYLVVLMVALPAAALDAAKAVTGAKQGATKAGAPSKAKGPTMITTDSGLKYVDTVVGTGAAPQKGQKCLVHYTGWLDDGRGGRGNRFDSSYDRGKPLPFSVGIGQVIKGWDEGVLSMKVGGKRTLYIPSYLGYGPRGAGGDIPPNANLIFDVELVGVQ
jgi:peptidylprolyl isomerase